MKTIDDVKKADVVKRIVARSIEAKVWRSECEKEALAYATKDERKIVIEYIRTEYDAAGAGFSGRW